MASARPRPRVSFALIGALLLYVAFRAWVLHTSFDSVAIPEFEVPVMGNLAASLATGEHAAPLSLYYDNCGGHVVTGLLAAPLYALFGDSYLTLKLVPLALGVLTIALLWRALARHYDRRAADLFALLAVLGPPTLAKFSLLAMGNHFENLAFQVAALTLFLDLHARGTTPRALFVASAAAGFALFFYFGSCVLIALLAALHALVRRRRALLDLPVAAAGFALGLAPLVWVQLASSDGRPGDFVTSKLRQAPAGGWDGFLERLRELFIELLPRASAFEDLGAMSGRIADVAFLGTFACAWLVLCASFAASARPVCSRSSERARFEAAKLLPFIGYLPLFALLVSFARFDFDPYGAPVEVGQFRYLVPHFLMALAAIALAAARLWRGRWLARRAGVGLAAIAFGCGAFTLPIADWSAKQPAPGARYSGHFFLLYANVLLRERQAPPSAPRWDVDRLRARIAPLSASHRRESWLGVGHYSMWARSLDRTGADWPSLALLLEPYPAELHATLARGAGSYLRRRWIEEGSDAELRAQLTELESENHPLLAQLIEGLCLDARYSLVRRGPRVAAASAAIGAHVPPLFQVSWRRGQGIQVGRIAARGLPSDLALAQHVAVEIPQDDAASFWSGFGQGLAEGADGAPLRVQIDALVPRAQRARALAGFELAAARPT